MVVLLTNTKEIIESSLYEKLRIDGRSIQDTRKIKLSLGELGQSECQIGRTRVLVQISCEIVRPHLAHPHEGVLFISTHISSMASPEFGDYQPSQKEIYISRILEKVLRKSRAIDTESLCIIVGEQVWAIRIDIHVLDHDGNIIDCACIASVAAMMHFKRPEVTVVNNQVLVHSFEEKHPVPLSILHIPICTTFSFFKNGEFFVVDPTSEEELYQDGTMTIVSNVHREISCISKAGGCPLDLDSILKCTQIASAKSFEITSQIREAVNQV